MYFLCKEPFSLVKSDEPIHACFCFLFFSSSNDVCSTFLIFGTRNVALLAPFSNPTFSTAGFDCCEIGVENSKFRPNCFLLPWLMIQKMVYPLQKLVA